MRFEPEFIRKLEGWVLCTRGRLSGGPAGRRPGRRPGSALEFADSRPYASGDEFRHIDWPAYARLETLRVRRFHEESEVEVLLAIDASASMGLGRPSRLDAACRLAAVLGGMALAAGEPVRLAVLRAGRSTAVSRGLSRASAGSKPPAEASTAARSLRGRGAWRALLEALDALRPGDGTDLARGLSEALGPPTSLCGRKGTHPRLAFLCSDFLDPRGPQPVLDVLSRRAAWGQVVHLAQADPVRPPLDGELELVDSETGEQLSLALDGPAWAAHGTAVAEHSAELERRCRASGLGHLRLALPLESDESLLLRLATAGVLA